MASLDSRDLGSECPWVGEFGVEGGGSGGFKSLRGGF